MFSLRCGLHFRFWIVDSVGHLILSDAEGCRDRMSRIQSSKDKADLEYKGGARISHIITELRLMQICKPSDSDLRFRLH